MASQAAVFVLRPPFPRHCSQINGFIGLPLQSSRAGSILPAPVWPSVFGRERPARKQVSRLRNSFVISTGDRAQPGRAWMPRNNPNVLPERRASPLIIADGRPPTWGWSTERNASASEAYCETHAPICTESALPALEEGFRPRSDQLKGVCCSSEGRVHLGVSGSR